LGQHGLRHAKRRLAAKLARYSGFGLRAWNTGTNVLATTRFAFLARARKTAANNPFNNDGFPRRRTVYELRNAGRGSAGSVEQHLLPSAYRTRAWAAAFHRCADVP